MNLKDKRIEKAQTISKQIQPILKKEGFNKFTDDNELTAIVILRFSKGNTVNVLAVGDGDLIDGAIALVKTAEKLYEKQGTETEYIA